MTRQHIVFLTGAGISAESGIPTYRWDGGLWNDHETVMLSSDSPALRRRQLLAECPPSERVPGYPQLSIQRVKITNFTTI